MSSVNIHYHGTNTSPTCHSDEVIKTLINSGQTFQYNVAFPTNEPPGLCWYHPHVHRNAEHAVLGGRGGHRQWTELKTCSRLSPDCGSGYWCDQQTVQSLQTPPGE